MTVELSSWWAPNPIAFMLAHLAPLGAGGHHRRKDDPVPFRMVNRIDGTDDLTLFCDKAILSVHTFAEGEEEALRQGTITDRRILLLAEELVDVPMSDGSIANVDYVDLQQKSIVSDYRVDDLVRLKAVCELHLAFT